MYNIQKEIENQIYQPISKILDEYLQGRTAGTKHAKSIISRSDYDSYFDGKKKTIYDAKKEFNKDSAISQLLKDIQYAGYNLLKNMNQEKEEVDVKKEYRRIVVRILNDIIKDRIAHEKDRKYILTFEAYKPKIKPKPVDPEKLKMIEKLKKLGYTDGQIRKMTLKTKEELIKGKIGSKNTSILPDGSYKLFEK